MLTEQVQSAQAMMQSYIEASKQKSIASQNYSGDNEQVSVSVHHQDNSRQHFPYLIASAICYILYNFIFIIIIRKKMMD